MANPFGVGYYWEVIMREEIKDLWLLDNVKVWIEKAQETICYCREICEENEESPEEGDIYAHIRGTCDIVMQRSNTALDRLSEFIKENEITDDDLRKDAPRAMF
jgi:hypothetical protein